MILDGTITLRIARLRNALWRAILSRAILSMSFIRIARPLYFDVLRIARLKIALHRAFLGRAILIFTYPIPLLIFCHEEEWKEIMISADKSIAQLFANVIMV